MKLLKFLFTLTCFFLIYNIAEADDPCDAPEASEIVRIYFANGMNNESDDIDNSKDALERLVGNTSNRNFGKSVNTKEAWYIQLLEVFAGRETESVFRGHLT